MSWALPSNQLSFDHTHHHNCIITRNSSRTIKTNFLMTFPQMPHTGVFAAPEFLPSASLKPTRKLDPVSLENVDISRRIIEVNFIKDPIIGCGFNIVGGVDAPHIPGHSGIFISRLNSEGPAAKDGRLRCGDRILFVNDSELAKKTHNEVINIFKQAFGKVRLLVEQDAEAVLLLHPSRIIPSTAASPASASKTTSIAQVAPFRGPVKVIVPTASPTVSPKRLTNSSMIAATPNLEINGPTSNRPDVVLVEDDTAPNSIKRGERHQSFREPPTLATYTVPEPATSALNSDSRRSSISNYGGSSGTNGIVLPGPHYELEDDRASTISVAPSTHSILDDVPKTPKKPSSIFDPTSSSIFTEALYVTVGTTALGIGIIAGYWFFKRRWGYV